MAFPVIVATNGGNSAGNVTTSTVNLPDGSNVAGRLVIVLFATDGTTTPSWPSSPAWTALSGPTSAQGCTFEARYRVLTGSEGYPATGATISVTHANEGSAHNSYLIKDHGSSTTAPTVGSAANGVDTTPDPPDCNPGSAKDYLWIACLGNDGNVAVTAAPTDFTSLINNRWANANGSGAGSAVRNLNASSLNPGTFTMGSDGWVAQTIAVHPGTEGSITAVGLDLAANYDMRVALGVASALAYDLRNAVGLTSSLAYDLRAAAGLTNEVVYNLANSVGSTTVCIYHLRQSAGLTSASNYDVSMAASGTLNIRYHLADPPAGQRSKIRSLYYEV